MDKAMLEDRERFEGNIMNSIEATLRKPPASGQFISLRPYQVEAAAKKIESCCGSFPIFQHMPPSADTSEQPASP